MRMLLALCLIPASALAAVFEVGDYGAKGDGITLNTQAIQRTIDAAAKARGTVEFRPGTYLSGALFLKSGVQFEVGEGVVIRGVQDPAAYPLLPTRVAGIEMTWPAALINVYRQDHVRIEGKGTIDGDGKFWWDSYWKLRHEYDAKGLRWAADYDAKRVKLIQVYDSADVDLQGLRLERSGFWTVHICYSSRISVDGVTIRNNIGGRGPSTDGIDIDSSSYVAVRNCDIECNDDAICLKAGRDADGLRVNRPSEHVTVRDCTVRDAAAGITFGSETSGGIHDVSVSGLHVFEPVPKGILFKSARTRGGTVERIDIRDLELVKVKVPVSVELNWNPSYSYAKIPSGVTDVPDYWRKLAEAVPPEKGMPHVRDVTITDLKATGAKEAFEVAGYSNDPIDGFTFDRIDIEAQSGGEIDDASRWTFKESSIKTADGSKVALKDCSEVRGLP